MVGRDGGSRGHKRSLLDSSSTAIRNQEGSCMGGGGFLSGNSAQVHNINTTWWGKLGERGGGEVITAMVYTAKQSLQTHCQKARCLFECFFLTLCCLRLCRLSLNLKTQLQATKTHRLMKQQKGKEVKRLSPPSPARFQRCNATGCHSVTSYYNTRWFLNPMHKFKADSWWKRGVRC